MLNKDKVNEIVADMQEEERKEKLRQEGIADKFLENRLEYYVAMGIKDKSFNALMEQICNDIKDLLINESKDARKNIKELVNIRVLDGISKYGLYVFFNRLNRGFYFSTKSTGGEFYSIYKGFYESTHEIHDWLEKEMEKEYLKEVNRREEQRKRWEDGLHTKEKKEERNLDILLITSIPIVILAIYLYFIYAK